MLTNNRIIQLNTKLEEFLSQAEKTCLKNFEANEDRKIF